MKIFKKSLLIALPIFLVFSCNKPPETYEQGLVKFKKQDYPGSIELFKLTPKDRSDWYDSSIMMINNAVNNIFKSNDLGKITLLCKKFEVDSLLKPILTKKIKSFWSEQMNNNPLVTFNLFDSTRFILKGETQIDSLMRANEDAFFRGIWKCPKGSLKGNEIYFDRDKKSKLIQGKSNKSTNGWSLGKVIYKDIYYTGNNNLEHKVRVFQTDYWGYTREYFPKSRGKMTIISRDSLLIDYEGSVSSNNKVYFLRKDVKK